MDMQILNKICFTVCIVCIVVGTVLGISMIWLPVGDSAFIWRLFLTMVLLFLASALTLSISKAYEGRKPRG